MKNKLKIFISVFAFLSIFIFSGKVSASVLDDEPIDVVIKYIDLTDGNLKRDGIPQIKKDFDNEELRYSLRSIIKNLPWVRKIFILMPNEKVRFLKDKEEISEKIVYIKDKDFLGFDSASSIVFEFNLWKMADFGCSKNFIYMNDDYFIGKPLKKSDFFYEQDGKVVPYVIHNRAVGRGKNAAIEAQIREMRKHISSGNKSAHLHAGFQYQKLSSIKFLYDTLGKNIITPAEDYMYFHHNALGENIDELKEVYDLVKKNYKHADACISAKFRNNNAFSHQTVYSFYIINKHGRKIKKLRGDYVDLRSAKNYANFDIPLFCINTGGDIKYTEEDYAAAKAAMNRAFPKPHKYERQDVSNGTYVIESALMKNKVMDIQEASNDAGANLHLWERNGTNAQKFRVQYNKKDGAYGIFPLCSDKSLDVAWAGTAEGTNIWQHERNSTNAQKWHVIPAGRGFYYISSVCNHLFADVEEAKTENGVNIRCWSPNGTNAQKFRFIKQ